MEDPDLTAQGVNLDRRMLDWAVGLDTEVNELVEGSQCGRDVVAGGQEWPPASDFFSRRLFFFPSVGGQPVQPGRH